MESKKIEEKIQELENKMNELYEIINDLQEKVYIIQEEQEMVSYWSGKYVAFLCDEINSNQK